MSVVLAQRTAEPNSAAAVVRSLIGAPSRFRPAGTKQTAQLVAPGAAHASVLTLRMRSRDPRVQMPPLGTAVPDSEAMALIERWIDISLQHKGDQAMTATAMNPFALKSFRLACTRGNRSAVAAQRRTAGDRGGVRRHERRGQDRARQVSRDDRGLQRLPHAVQAEAGRRRGARHEPHAVRPSGGARDAARARVAEGPWKVVSAATNTAWSGPWGVSFTANLTPDPETGLGKWTFRNFKDTIRTRPSHGPRPADPAADADPDVQAHDR